MFFPLQKVWAITCQQHWVNNTNEPPVQWTASLHSKKQKGLEIQKGAMKLNRDGFAANITRFNPIVVAYEDQDQVDIICYR